MTIVAHKTIVLRLTLETPTLAELDAAVEALRLRAEESIAAGPVVGSRRYRKVRVLSVRAER